MICFRADHQNLLIGNGEKAEELGMTPVSQPKQLVTGISLHRQDLGGEWILEKKKRMLFWSW